MDRFVTELNREQDFLQWMVDRSTIDLAAMKRVKSVAPTTAATVDSIILELGILNEEALADEFAAFLGVERVSLDSATDVDSQLPVHLHDYLISNNLLPLASESGYLHLATARPFFDESAKAAAYFSGLELVMKVATATQLEQKIAELRNETSKGTSDQPETMSIVSDGDAEKLRDLASEAPVIRLLSRIVASAVEQNASDIHLEPMDHKLQVRFRIDGVLRVEEMLNASSQLALTSRIKILARLNIAEHRLPQDGRIRLAVRGKNIDFRVATAPTTSGESVVLRILDKRGVNLDFSSLGFLAEDDAKLQKTLQKRDGIVLVTGPTGSGKTTTLYAALALLNRPETKIFSIEDPVEYQMAGVNQIPVRANIGLDFAKILRSVLRQDPDIIMIGEIRDAETAQVAVQASLTGHLVLSTAHTNSAVSAITRLRDLGIEDYLLASSLRAVVAQRLVRKLCQTCGGHANPASVCPTCQGLGFNGRTAVYELLEISPKLQRAIAENANDLELLGLAKLEGFSSMSEHGGKLVEAGTTSRKEVERAVATVD